MEYILVVVTVFMFCAQTIALRKVEISSLRQNILITACATGLIALVLGGQQLISPEEISLSTVLFAIAFGVLFVFVLAVYYFAMQCGPLSYTTFFFTASMILPSLAGLLFWGDPFKWTVLLAIGMFLVAFYFISVLGGEKGGKISGKWIILCFFSWLGNGGLAVIMGSQQEAQAAKGEALQYMPMMFLSFVFACLSALLVYAVLALREKKGCVREDMRFLRRYVPMTLWIAFGTGAGNVLTAYLKPRLPSSYLFPCFQGGQMLMITLYAALFLGERPNKYGKIGLLIGLAAIIVINL